MKKPLLKAILISIFTYLVFFYPLLNPKLTMYSGSDTTKLHYPKRYYLYEKLKEGEFPFWTERIFSGFPIYADIESGYLHPINLVTTYIFGPILSYKLLHFGFYLLGSLSLYVFLRRKKFSLPGFFVSNLIYFFCFFHIYHQQHFNMIWATYMFPTTLLLMELFLELKKMQYLFLDVLLLANIFYLGSLQILVLFLLVHVLQISIFVWDTLEIKEVLYYLILGLWIFMILILPLLVPAFNLYKISVRQRGNLLHTEGSLAPALAVNIFYPFIFESGENYKGISVSPEYFKHEVYVYVGITVLVFAVVGFLIRGKDRIGVLLKTFVALFLLLGFIKYVPVLNKLFIFPLSLFRYWIRSVVLFSFVASFYAGFFVSNLNKKVEFKVRKIRILLLVPIFLFLIQTIYIFDPTFIRLAKYLKSHFNFNRVFGVWLVLFVVSVLLVGSVLKKIIRQRELLVFLVCALVFVDLFFFGRIVLNPAFRSVSLLVSKPPISKEFNNKRVVAFDDRLNTNRGLLYKSWSPFGYSQFAPKDYTDFMVGLGFKDVKSVERREGFTLLDIQNNLDELGATFLGRAEPSQKVVTFPFKSCPHTKILDLREGYVRAESRNETAVQVDTFIRSYAGWELYVDGVKKPLNMQSSAFLSFSLPAGEHIVEMRYIPKHFNRGLIYSVVLALGLAVVYTSKSLFSNILTEKTKGKE